MFPDNGWAWFRGQHRPGTAPRRLSEWGHPLLGKRELSHMDMRHAVSFSLRTREPSLACFTCHYRCSLSITVKWQLFLSLSTQTHQKYIDLQTNIPPRTRKKKKKKKSTALWKPFPLNHFSMTKWKTWRWTTLQDGIRAVSQIPAIPWKKLGTSRRMAWWSMPTSLFCRVSLCVHQACHRVWVEEKMAARVCVLTSTLQNTALAGQEKLLLI